MVQIGPCEECIEANVARGLGLVDRAVASGAGLVVLPELFNTTFFAVGGTEDPDRFFEPIPGPTTDRLAEAARAGSCGIVAGIAERTSAGRYYNSAVVIDSRGAVVGVYRKTHLPLMVSPPERVTYEANYFSRGDLGLPVFEVDGVKVGVLICYDRHFPEAFRTLALRGAEVIAVPTGARTWKLGWRSSLWEALLRTRAYENGVFVAAANRAGTELGTSYLGDSMIISPAGATILGRSAPEALDDVVVADCELDEVRDFRDAIPFRRDLRPEIYDLSCQAGPDPRPPTR